MIGLLISVQWTDRVLWWASMRFRLCSMVRRRDSVDRSSVIVVPTLLIECLFLVSRYSICSCRGPVTVPSNLVVVLVRLVTVAVTFLLLPGATVTALRSDLC